MTRPDAQIIAAAMEKIAAAHDHSYQNDWIAPTRAAIVDAIAEIRGRVHEGVLVRAVEVYFACRKCKRLLTREEWAEDCPGGSDA